MTEQAGRDILEGWRSDRVAKDIYKAALDDLYSEWQVFKGDMTAQIAEISDVHARERQEWERELRRAKRAGVGVFIAPAYTNDGKVRFVISVGWVWKVF